MRDPKPRSANRRATQQLKNQHRRLHSGSMGAIQVGPLKAWARYIANGVGQYPELARGWLKRKGLQ